jgi:O-antigen/teichoic acid export membrane protein
VLLNLALIPRFHALGAAAATVMAECVLLLATTFCVRRFVLPMRDAAVVEVTPC